MQLLDYYRYRYGDAVKRMGDGFNGPCPLCGGEPGKSDRFVVWPHKSERVGEACARNGISGIWWCRQCGAGGDTIAYLTQIDGMSFKEALAELGIAEKMPLRRRFQKAAPQEPRRHAEFTPKSHEVPADTWQARAMKLVEEGEKAIWNNAPALRWLRARGISDAAIAQYRLGYLVEESAKYHGRFRPRQAFGLAPKTGQDGQVHDKLYIPRGIIIPTFAADGNVLNIRIRRHKADLRERSPKYMELEGSCHAPLFLISSQPLHLGIYFVTEAELDAMLIHHVSGGVVGALAVRTNRGKPDATCLPSLQAAARVCVALDYDEAGYDGCGFWEENFANYLRWPTPQGKDPGDAFALGVDMKAWIAAALPPSVRLPENQDAIHRSSIAQNQPEIQANASNGHVEPCSLEQEIWGEGQAGNLREDERKWPSEARARCEARAAVCAQGPDGWQAGDNETMVWASESDFTPEELIRLRSALPRDTPLNMILLDVAVLWLLWDGKPIAHVKHRDKDGELNGGSGLTYDYDWYAKNEADFDLFWQHWFSSRDVRAWFNDMPVDRITSRNVLRLYDLLAQQNNGVKNG